MGATSGVMFSISPIYIGLGVLLTTFLSFAVIRQRRRHQVGIGDGGVEALQRAIRAQGNCAEYVPLLLLVVAATEISGAPGWVVHLLGITAILGRVLHSIGITRSSGASVPRILGMLMTFSVLLAGGMGLVAHALM